MPNATEAHVQSDRISLQDLETPPRQDNVLEIRIHKGRLVGVRWRGSDVPELTQDTPMGTPPTGPTGGGFGLYACPGGNRFS